MANAGEKSFWKNPWVWVTGGCCLGCVAVPLIIIAVAGTGAFVAFTSSGFSDLKDEAVELAKASPEVVEVLGEPIEAGWPRNSSVNLSNGEGRAELLLPLSGPNGSGVLAVEGTKPKDGPWTFELLEFRPDNQQQTINLLPENNP